MNKNIRKLILKFNFMAIVYINKFKKLAKTNQNGYDLVRKIVLDINKKLKLDVNIIGLENVPTDTNYTLFCNHRGVYDPLAIISCIDRHLSFAMKEELSNNVLTCNVAKITGSKFLKRNPRDDLKIVLEMIEETKQGKTFVIFPEGTRNTSDELLEFKAGAFKVPQKSKVDILPAVVYKTENVFDKDTKDKRITIEFLPVIKYDDFKTLKTNELSDMVRTQIQTEYKKNKQG